MTHTEQALKLFVGEHCRCSQAVLTPFAQELGLTQEQALRVAGCFGSGMNMGATCGCVTGGLMALGLKYGRSVPDDEAGQAREAEVAKEFVKRFQAALGDTTCRGLLGEDVTDPETLARVKAQNLFYTHCPKLVTTAVKLVEELLEEGW